jgi:deoxycytidylate deaminase
MNELYPELIFGLVGAIGTELGQVEDALKNALASVGYIAVPIKLSDLMRELNSPWSTFPGREDPEYYEKAMDAGNKLREKLQDAGVLANLAIASIRRRRDKAGPEDGRKVAYILNSLKRPEEIDSLRRIYGPSVFIISAYSPRAARVNRVATLLAERQHENQSTAYRGKAEELITRDENEKSRFGQGVRKAYPFADLFVRTSSLSNLRTSINRFVDLLFGDVWKTPTKDEEGMAFANLACLRSASPARQVGASITDDAGRILGVGMNDVAKPKGGQYWEGDTSDSRDFLYDDYDISDKMRLNLLSDVIDRMRKLDYLSPSCPANNELLDPESESYKFLRDAQLFDTIDFIRAVHAEASALFSAGFAARGATMYVTTFPCHECARHIVISGIKRVVYVEPYPKSLVSELFRDSISVDSEEQSDQRIQFVPFVGIAPSVYSQLFRLTPSRIRKQKDGKIGKWSASSSFPHLSVSYSAKAARVAETAMIGVFTQKLVKEGIVNEQN